MKVHEVDAPEIRFGANMIVEKQVLITEKHAKAQSPARLHVTLFPHQETAVQALLDLEDQRVFAVRAQHHYQHTAPETLVASSAVLSEPVGSGKTYIILGMIAHRQVPKALPLIANAVVISGAADSRRLRYGNDVPQPMHEINVRFTGPRALIKPNLVVVGASVLLQWEAAVRQNTNFRVLTIGDFHGMNQFKRFLEAGDLNQFQVVLMKNGTVTGNLNIGTETKTYMSMIYAMAELTKEYQWSRVFYDDFDTIKIPPGSCTINALFTVYVSATEKRDNAPTKKDRATYKNLAEMLEARVPIPLMNVIQDRLLFTNFNVKNDPAFTERSTKITLLEQFRYVYDNPDDNFIRVMGAIGDDEAKETIEALNAGAYGHAAQKWGCESKSAGDIFRRMLDKQYDRYMVSVNILEAIEKTRVMVQNLPEYPEDKKFKQKVIEQIRGAVVKKMVPTVKYFDERIITALDEMHLEYTHAKDRDGVAIQRVIDNVKQGDCQVCCLPLDGFDVFIVRCCGLIVCDTCGIKGNQIALRYNYKVRGNVVCGKCANCKADVFPQTDLIFVDHKFDMSGLLKAKGDEVPLAAVEAEPEPEPAIEDTGPKEAPIKNPKLRALYSIIRGEKLPEREKVNVVIKNLLTGTANIPQPAGLKKKILLFAGFDESLTAIEEFCVERKIEYLRLCGNFRQMAETVKKFRTYGTILLINSQQNCAGLNLEFSTDLVFFHKNTNENVECQIAGRIQRIGRTCNAHIHHLWYRNERNL